MSSNQLPFSSAGGFETQANVTAENFLVNGVITTGAGSQGSAVQIANITTGATTTIATVGLHGLTTGNKIKIYGITTTTELNDLYYVNVIDSYTITLYTDEACTQAVDSSGYTAYTYQGPHPTYARNVSWSSDSPFAYGSLSFDGSTSYVTVEAGVYYTTCTFADGGFTMSVAKNNIPQPNSNWTLIWNNQTFSVVSASDGGSVWNLTLNGGNSGMNGVEVKLVNVPVSTPWSLGTTWTIEWWEKLSSASDAGVVWPVVCQAPGETTIDIFHRDGKIKVANGFYAFPEPTPGQWNHVAIVNNGGTVTSYVNGVIQTPSSNGAVSLLDPSNIPVLGRRGYSNGGYGQYFPGKLAGLRVNSTALHTGAFTPSTSAPGSLSGDLLLLKMHNSSTAVVDASGTVNVYNHSSTFGTDAPYASLGGSMVFDGTSALQIKNNTQFAPSGDWTIEFFVKRVSAGQGSTPHLFSIGSNTNTMLRVFVDSYGQIQSNAWGPYSTGFIPGVDDDVWHHFAVRSLSGIVSIYWDGVLLATEPPSSFSYDSAKTFTIGAASPDNDYGSGTVIANTGFAGKITNFRFVNGTSVYNPSTVAVPSAPLNTGPATTDLLLLATDSGSKITDSTTTATLNGGGNLAKETASDDLILTVGATPNGEDPGNVIVKSGTSAWTFNGTVGNLILPSNTAAINYANGMSIMSGINANIGLGNLYVVDQTIHGNVTNRDIVLTPAGSGIVSVPGIKIPTGAVIQGTAAITVTIADLEIYQVLDYSTGPTDDLILGDYGLTNGISGGNGGWTVYELTTEPNPVLQIGDYVAGVAIPFLSNVLYIGTGANANVIITNRTINSLPAQPGPGTLITTSRDVVNAGFNLTTTGNVDVGLFPGTGGTVITGSSVLPFQNDVYDLGSPSKRFRRLWLGAGTLYILDETLGTDQAIGARDGVLYLAGGAGLQVGEFTFFDNEIRIANPARDIIIGSLGATGNVQFNRSIKLQDSMGRTAFTTDHTGRARFYPPTILANDIGGVSIIGSTNGTYHPVTSTGGMLHITGNDGASNRVSIDAFGAGGNQSFNGIIARAGRGTAASPSQLQANDIILRLAASGWRSDTGFSGVSAGGASTSLDFVSLESTTNATRGSAQTFYNAPLGGNARTFSLQIDSTGITLPNISQQFSFGNTGITFTDDSRQTTAYIPNQNVNSLNIGVGFQQSGVYSGAVNIDSAGVLTVVGTPDQITVANAAQNLTLSLPQSINTNSSPVFGNLTITGNLYVSGNVFSSGPVAVEGINLYLGNAFTTSEGINTGGIILGNTLSASSRTFLYKYPADVWSTAGAGLETMQLNAVDAVFTGDVFSNGQAHFGGDYMVTNWPNSELQVDSNVNDYSQVISQNHSSGTQASTDFVATNDVADGLRYIDMGINSSTYNNPLYSIGGANSGYLYTAGGNLTIGTQTAGNVILFHTGNTTMSNWRANINDNGLVVRNMITSLDGITASANVIAPAYVGSGRYLTDLYSNANVAAYLTTSTVIQAINANVTAANLRINTIDANVGNISIYTNSLVANAAYQQTQINNFNANVGAYETWANSAIINVANVTTGIYGSFWDNTTVAANASIIASGANISFGNVFGNLGVYVTNNNRVHFTANGTYKIDYSLQFHNAQNKQNNATVWFRKNGANVPNSASWFTLPAQGYICAVSPYIDTVTTNDYFQVSWTADATQVSLSGIPSTGPMPASPAVILTVSKI